MALISYTTGRKAEVIPIDKAIHIWQALNGEIEVSEQQKDYLMTVKRVAWDPNRHPETPFSYLQAHKTAVLSKACETGSRVPELTSPGIDRLTQSVGPDKD